jgi:hypothetical protein
MAAREPRSVNLTFDPAEHRYFWQGREVPSVTRALAPLIADFLARIPPDVLERKRQIGQAVHSAIALDIANDLDESTVDPACEGYVAAWRRFRSEAGLTEAYIGAVEQRRYHDLYRYAGTPDMELCLGRWAVVDTKCSYGIHPAVGPQTAAYRELINREGGKGEHAIQDRYALHLKPDGTYRLEQLKEQTDLEVFRSCLAIHHWKERHP